MDAKQAMELGMKIAEKQAQWFEQMIQAKPEITPQEAQRGTQVALGSEIMKILLDHAPDRPFSDIKR